MMEATHRIDHRISVGVRRDATWIVLGLLWTIVTWRLHYIWARSPEHAYGWIVPVLAAFMLAERWRSRPAASPDTSGPGWLGAVVVGGVVFCGARIALAPFPIWPAMLWSYSLAAVLLSIAAIGYVGGRRSALHFAFPLGFMLTAIPWPELVRQKLVGLFAPIVTQIAAAIVNEFIGPAIQRGNIIEIGGGTLGVEEACTGLRSFQATLMIVLFAGEFFGLERARRCWLVPIGGAFALAINILRTTALAAIAALSGINAVATAHDIVGYVALAVTVLGVLAIAAVLRRSAPWQQSARHENPSSRRGRMIAMVVVGTVAASEGGTWLWFGSAKPAAKAFAGWDVTLPRNQFGFRPISFSREVYALLDCDDAEGAVWADNNGMARAGYYLRWRHGHEAAFQLALHNPSICLPFAGVRLLREVDPIEVVINTTRVRFTGWEFLSAHGALVVYSCALALPAKTPVTMPALGAVEWLKWRWRILRTRERDENVLVVTVGLSEASGTHVTREEVTAEIARMFVGHVSVAGADK
jgi:exosortase